MEKLEQRKFNTEMLQKYGTEITRMAKEGKLDPVVGRDREVERVTQILCKRRKNNPCLVGDPGIGKTVIAEELSQRIVNATIPLKLQGKSVFSVEMARLIAGAANRGEFEERLMNLVAEVKASEGATTLEEYRKYIEKDPALERRFQQVLVPEPSVEETIQILQNLSKKYADYHNVHYSPEALTAAASLSKRFISDRFLPDKAIDLMDEAGSRVQLREAGSNAKIGTVTSEDIEQVNSSWTGIPVQKEDTVSAVCRSLWRARVGRRDPDRPIVSFLFTGSSGVGKTQLAKLLAAGYFGSKDAMVRLDMSEYMERHSVSRLVGSPPGYLSHEPGGQLTEAVRRRPHSVILLDEVEKAHADVCDAMLQVLDDGRLTDGKGRTVGFNNTIIIMTSNVGGSQSESFGDDEETVHGLVGEELRGRFRPEFLNRLDEVVVFKRLRRGQVGEIVGILVREVGERLVEAKNVKLLVTERVVREGYNPRYGARPLRRAVTRLLEDTLAERILKGEIRSGKLVTVDVNGDGNVFVCTS